MAARTNRKTESRGSLRAQRGAAAVTAQYVRELSLRHGGPVKGRARRAKAPWAGCYEAG